MRLKITESKNSKSFYVIRSTYKNGVHSSEVVEKLGTYEQLSKKHKDPVAWAKEYIDSLNKLEKEQHREVLVKYKQSVPILKQEQRMYNSGYLFLQQIYHDLKLDAICKDISKKHKFTFNLDSILSRLLYGRVIFPSSKLNTFEQSKVFLEQPDFDLQHIYRALDIIEKEDSFIQSQLYKNSKELSKRNDKVLFYDCTNFFFEVEQEAGIKQYGPSKEHRPNPIVEMGLFMDGDGIPLAFSIHSGNKNEQQTLIPLEQQIIKDFDHAKFVVCTDAGLSSAENRKFNNKGERAFITTQSIKKLKKHLKDWCLAPTGWHLKDKQESFDISKLENHADTLEQYKNCTFYKERWIKEDGLEQKLIVTYSLKYKLYQQTIRTRQVNRAKAMIEHGPSSLKQHNQNDCKRFIHKQSVTSSGEIAEKVVLEIDEAAIHNESIYDGFYAVCTNLEDNATEIAKINHNRWEIEECFRIMKTDFLARPVYLQNDNRIKAHFMTCFLSLILFRYLEKKLDYKYTSTEIITTLRDMNLLAASSEGYIPTYTRTDITDALHDAFGFRTDYQIISQQQIKKIIKMTKK